MAETAKQNLTLKADHQATAALKAKYQDEFFDLKEKAAADLGIEWTRPESEEAKAARTIEELLAEHPGLRSKFEEDGVKDTDEPDGDKGETSGDGWVTG